MMVHLFDTTAFLHRAAHVVYRRSVHTVPPTDQRFLLHAATMIANVMTRLDVTHAIFARDSSTSIRRDHVWSGYKVGKKDTPPVIHAQSDEFFAALGEVATVWLVEGYEADDLIADAATALCGERNVVIVSSDKDMMPLISASPAIEFYDPMKDAWVTEDTYREKFMVEPAHGYWLHAMVGDASDTIRGVPRLGIKTAAKLLNHFGNMRAILDADLNALSQVVKPNLAQSIIDNRATIELNLRLIQPMPVGDLVPTIKETNAASVRKLFAQSQATAAPQ